MIDFLLNLKSSFRWTDLLDLGIVAFIVYRLLLIIRGTRAMQMLTGLGIIGIAFFISSTSELFTTHWLLAHFFDYLIIIVIVLFQDDLRRALTHVGKNPFFSSTSFHEARVMIDEIIKAALRMGREEIGGLIVIERETGLKNFIATGAALDANIRAELIYSIFVPNSPIHDGAIILSGGKIAAAGCFLPLSKEPRVNMRYGTRHRAAFGLSEETDALIVLISEESGEVHIVHGGHMSPSLDEQMLSESLTTLLTATKTTRRFKRRMTDWLFPEDKKSSSSRGGGSS